jgi:hypothetical protein
MNHAVPDKVCVVPSSTLDEDKMFELFDPEMHHGEEKNLVISISNNLSEYLRRHRNQNHQMILLA